MSLDKKCGVSLDYWVEFSTKTGVSLDKTGVSLDKRLVQFRCLRAKRLFLLLAC